MSVAAVLTCAKAYPRYYATLRVAGGASNIRVLLDSGSVISLLNMDTYIKLGSPTLNTDTDKFTSASGDPSGSKNVLG